jgi:purine-binding chemotaxis protein CheW
MGGMETYHLFKTKRENEMAENNQDNFDELTQLVSFTLNDEMYGVDILRVQEINRMVSITKIPQTPEYIEGVINLRGKVIPIIDIRKKFQIFAKEWNKDTRIIVVDVKGAVVGMVVDSVSEVLRIPKSSIEPAPKITSSIDTDYITGVVKLDDKLLIFLEVDKIAVEVSEEIENLVAEPA